MDRKDWKHPLSECDHACWVHACMHVLVETSFILICYMFFFKSKSRSTVRNYQDLSNFYGLRVNECFPWPPQDADSHLGGADRRRGAAPRYIRPAVQDQPTAARGVWLGKLWPSPSQKEAPWPQPTTPARAPSMSTTAQWSLWVPAWEPVFWSRAPGRTCTGKTRSAKSMTTEPTHSSGGCFLIVQGLIGVVPAAAFIRINVLSLRPFVDCVMGFKNIGTQTRVISKYCKIVWNICFYPRICKMNQSLFLRSF